VVNSTIADNAGVGIAAGIVAWNTIVAGNGTDLGGPLGGGGSNLVGGTPGFAGAGDYHLASGSPAIDTGDNTAVPASLLTDADGDPRILNAGSGTARVDIGWDEALGGWQGSGSDAGTDAGPSDAGSTEDAGPADAGSADAGSPDAGSPDAGPSDAGPDGGISVGGTGADAGSSTGGGSGCSSSPGGALAWLGAATWMCGRRRKQRAMAPGHARLNA
jgi:uncharacterized protein (TIGR03382 family)